MKKFWRTFHLGLALLSALFLLVLCGSGALLVYAKPLQTAWQPQYWQVPEQIQTQVALLSYGDLIHAAQSQTGQQVKLLSVEQDPTLAWQAQLVDGSYVSLNPYNGTVLYHYQSEETLYGFTMSLHRWLLWQDNGERPLQNLVSTVATMLLMSLLSGLYLWAKPKQRLKRLQIRWRAKPQIRWQQLHSVLGVWFCVPLCLLAFSGIAFHWTTPTKWLVETLSGEKIVVRPAAPLLPYMATSGTATEANAIPTATSNAEQSTKLKPVQLQTAISQGLAALPGAELFRIQLPQQATDPLLLRLKVAGEFYPNSYVWVDPQNAKVVQSHDASQLGLSTQIWNFRYPFHIGNFAGPIVQAFWILLALLPVFFSGSGLYLYLQRRSKRK